MSGWTLVDAAFLAGERRDLSSAELNLYFDGAVPKWRHVLAEAIPRRGFVDQFVAEFENQREKKAGPLFKLLLGAGGEGKSTMVLQVAAELAQRSPWGVLWRPDASQGLDAGELVDLAPEASWLLVTDDADSLVGPLMLAAQAIHNSGVRNVHVLGCARDTDWNAAGGSRKGWASSVTYRREWLRGIDKDDALRISGAWHDHPREGLQAAGASSVEEQAAAFMSAAKTEAARPGDGSFFGGLLDARFTPDGLLAHVSDLMERLNERPTGEDRTLRDALLYISCCHAIGIPGLDHRVLADLVGVGHDRVKSLVELPLGEEAGGVRAGTALMTRHRRVAEAVVVVAVRDFTVDLGERYAAIVEQTIRTTEDVLADGGRQIWPHGPVVHCRRAILDELPEGIGPDQRLNASIAASYAAHSAEPHRLSYVMDLARAYKSAGLAEDAVDLCRKTDPDPQFHLDYEGHVRGFYSQWAVSEGLAQNYMANAWLAACSISDFLRPRLSREDVGYALSQIGFGMMRTWDDTQAVWLAKGVRACAYLGGLRIDAPPAQLDLFRRQARAADEAGAPHPSAKSEALSWIEEAVEAERHRPELDELFDLGPVPGLSFSGLADLLGIKDEEPAQGTPTADLPPVPKVGRNQPCPCGSGQKYKRCHGRR